MASQTLQIPVFFTPWGGYYCIGGAGLRVTLAADGSLSSYVHLGSQLHVQWTAEPYITAVGVNVIAVLLLALLVVYRPPSDARASPRPAEGAA
jgi:hypothetical protein